MRAVIALLTVAAMVLCAEDLFANEPVRPLGATGKPDVRRTGRIAAFLNGLNLTAEQEDRVKALKEEYETKFEATDAKRRQLPNDVSPRSLMQALDVQEAENRLETECRKALEEVLTPEQKEKLKAREAAAKKASQPEAMPLPEPVIAPVTSEAPEDGRGPFSTKVLPPIEIKLENCRWQALPPEVASVATSPDGRLWYLMAKPSEEKDLSRTAVREVVEREFSKPAPQLQGVRGIFFETVGTKGEDAAKVKRVWLFRGDPSQSLMGYDGKQWIERRETSMRFAKTFFERKAFFQLDGEVAFLAESGCLVLRETNWIYQSFIENRSIPSKGVAWLDPDGKGLTLFVGSGKKRVWHYREGIWTSFRWPENLNESWVCKLGDNLYGLGPGAVPGYSREEQLAMFRKGKPIPEVPVLNVSSDGKVEPCGPQEMITAGPYRFRPTSRMTNDFDGTFYASCQEARQGSRKLGPGVLICDPSGKAGYVLWHEELRPELQQFIGEKFLVDGGKRAWMGGVLYDTEKLTELDRLPVAGFRVVAATDDGTAFCRHYSTTTGDQSGWLMVYRPGAADTRKPLAGQKAAFEGGNGYCIAGDGCIWASRGDFLQRFDGKKWRSCGGLKANVKALIEPYSLIPAQGGWVATFVGHRDFRPQNGMATEPLFGPQYLLLNGEKLVATTPNKKWVSENRAVFLAAFAEPCVNRPWHAHRPWIARQEGGGRITINHELQFNQASVVVDKNKNIWVSLLESVFVVTDKKVIDVSIPPDRGNPSGGPRRVASIALLGDGEYVFFRLADGNTFFVRLTADDDFDFSKGPKLYGYAALRPLRDRQGGLWMSIENPKGTQYKDGRTLGITVRRLTAPDKEQDFTDMGEAQLVDAAGCVWLAPTRGPGNDVLTIWEPSGKTSTLHIPGRMSGGELVAGPKGKVFAWTALGLQECVAKDPEKPSEYTLGEVYCLKAAKTESLTNLSDMQYSSLGYLVGVNSDLYLFPLGAGQTAPDVAQGAESATEDEAKPKPKPDASKVRVWKDSTGSFSIEAEFVSAAAGKVKLRKADGSILVIPLEKLSEPDQKWIRRR